VHLLEFIQKPEDLARTIVDGKYEQPLLGLVVEVCKARRSRHDAFAEQREVSMELLGKLADFRCQGSPAGSSYSTVAAAFWLAGRDVDVALDRCNGRAGGLGMDAAGRRAGGPGRTAVVRKDGVR